MVLRDLDLKFIVRDEVLLVTTAAQAETIMLIRVYPVGDLIDHGADDAVDAPTPEELIETISTTVAPTTWSEVGGAGAIKSAGQGNLVVTQTEEVHEQIRDFFVALRKAGALERAQAKESAAASDPNKLFVAMYRVVSHPRPYKVAVAPAAGGGSSVEVSVNEVYRGPAMSPTDGSAIEISVNGPPESPPENSPMKIAGTDGKPVKGKLAVGPQNVIVSNRGLAEDLARVIPKLIEPESWQAQGGTGSIESIDGAVFVRQTRKVQHEVERFLRSIEVKNRRAQIGAGGVMGGGGGMF